MRWTEFDDPRDFIDEDVLTGRLISGALHQVNCKDGRYEISFWSMPVDGGSALTTLKLSEKDALLLARTIYDITEERAL